ncbi:MAG: WecB/TagA/CpsF family glycosyltransferase [Elainellaceae cyanobacterium]
MAKRLEQQKHPDQGQEARVLGLPVHILDDYSSWLLQQVERRRPIQVVTLNAEMAMQAEGNAALAEIIRSAELVVPDGAGVVLYLRLRNRRIQRCPGIELAESLLARVGQSSDDHSVFFYGGAPGVTQDVAQRWQSRAPQLRIAGVEHGYITPEEQDRLRDRLRREQPALILVGLGVPRQEFWIAEHRHLCPNSVWIGVGGSFDIWAGAKTRAPAWLRNNNLEWSYRLYKEPWRWRRMLVLPQFAWRAVRTLGR